MEKVFIKRDIKPEPGFNIGVLLSKKATKGVIGLEIEVEGKHLPMNDLVAPIWDYHIDHSLRGAENAEYVLHKPIEFSELDNALDALWQAFRTKKSVLDESNRTSVHVHLNCQMFHFNRLASLTALFYSLEEILTAWCGEHRVGNLFCLRAVDAPAIVTQMKNFLQSDGKATLRDTLHYAGLNSNALVKFGSLEFRHLRGTSDPDVIKTWVGILERLYRLSADFKDPRDICGLFSAEGPLPFFESIVGDKASAIRGGIGWSDDEIRDSVFRGIRLAQDLCYCRDWSNFQALDIKADPFGRDIKKVMNKLAGNHGQTTLNSLDAAVMEFAEAHAAQSTIVMPEWVDSPEPDYEG